MHWHNSSVFQIITHQHTSKHQEPYGSKACIKHLYLFPHLIFSRSLCGSFWFDNTVVRYYISVYNNNNDGSILYRLISRHPKTLYRGYIIHSLHIHTLMVVNYIWSHSWPGADWLKRGCQFTPTAHAHSYRAMWVKCLAHEHNGTTRIEWDSDLQNSSY